MGLCSDMWAKRTNSRQMLRKCLHEFPGLLQRLTGARRGSQLLQGRGFKTFPQVQAMVKRRTAASGCRGRTAGENIFCISLCDSQASEALGHVAAAKRAPCTRHNPAALLLLRLAG